MHYQQLGKAEFSHNDWQKPNDDSVTNTTYAIKLLLAFLWKDRFSFI